MNQQAKAYFKNLSKKARISVINHQLDVIDLFLEHGTIALPQVARMTKANFPARRVMSNLARFEVIQTTGVKKLWYFQSKPVQSPDYELSDQAADYVALILAVREAAQRG